MTPRRATRTQACSAAEARGRLDHARKFLEVAELVAGDGTQAAGALRRLLNLKDEAHYGFFGVGGAHLRAALRQAQALVTFADAVLRR